MKLHFLGSDVSFSRRLYLGSVTEHAEKRLENTNEFQPRGF